MVSAASSALRVDEAAYGSLEGLGMSAMGGLGNTPRKLKKKPVLVLDANELAAAHAAFHEASAEQLGETVERAPKPAMILGLAPMEDDDADEMGQADDVGEDADTGQPSPEAVLSLTRRKSAPVLDNTVLDNTLPDDSALDDPAVEDYAELPLAEKEQVAEEPEIGPGPIERLGTIEDGLDIANRIFPSLNIVNTGSAQDDVANDPPAPFPAALSEQAESAPPSTPAGSKEPPIAKPSALDAIGKRLADSQPAAPVEPVETVKERVEAPVKPPAAAPASPVDDAPKPVRFDELNPAKDYETPEEAYDLDSWLTEEPEDEPALPEAEEPQPQPEFEHEPILDLEDELVEEPIAVSQDVLDTFTRDADEDFISEAQPDTAPEDESFTLTEDDEVDGYAFLQEQPSRRTGATTVQRGQHSALRAKLLREAEDERAAEESAGSQSLFARIWAWLRSRLGR